MKAKFILFLALALSLAGVTTSCKGSGAKKAMQAVEKAFTKTPKKKVPKINTERLQGAQYVDDAVRLYNKADDDKNR